MALLPFAERFPPETLYGFPLARRSAPPSSTQLSSLLRDSTFAEWGEASVAAYVHVPFCLSLCQFCGFIKTPLRDRRRLDVYLEEIKREVDVVSSVVGRQQRIRSIYFGGGTPSVLDVEQISAILERLRSAFVVDDCCELSIEGEALTLRDPGYLEGLAGLGFRRLSFGVQTLDPVIRRVLNLRPTFEQLRDVCRGALCHFHEVNVDFIYGWPAVTEEHATRDVRRLVDELRPTSVEVFQFEALDSSPELLAHLNRAGFRQLSTCELQAQRRSLVETLRDSGYAERTYTKFVGCPGVRPLLYDDCYYGWNNGQVLGFGRGSQSFYKGLMWGSAHSEAEHSRQLSLARVPMSAHASFRLNERELVTWPRRGFIDAALAEGHPESRKKVQRLLEAGLVRAEASRILLTPKGVDWVPSILNYLIPHHHRGAIEGLSEARLGARTAAVRSKIPLVFYGSRPI